jgi:hypothetical protein
MFMSQRVLRTEDPERAWSNIFELQNAANALGLSFAQGGVERGADGVFFSVFVDQNPRVPVKEAACIQVAHYPEKQMLDNPGPDGEPPGLFVVQTRAADPATFEDLLDLANSKLDAYTLTELADRALNEKAVSMLGHALVGHGFESSGYSGLCRALESEEAACRAKAAWIARELSWRSMVRPLHRALLREPPSSPARTDIEAALAALDPHPANTCIVLSRETTLDDAIVAAREVLKDGRCPAGAAVFRPSPESFFIMADSGVDAEGRALGELVVGVHTAGATVVLSHAPRFRSLVEMLLPPLCPASEEELTRESLEGVPGALVRRVIAQVRYSPELDDLLTLALRSESPSLREDALWAVLQQNWASALPDVYERRELETEPHMMQLVEACLQQVH